MHNALDYVMVGILKEFFQVLDITQRRSIQFQDAYGQVSDLTDLAAKPPNNLFHSHNTTISKC